MLIAAALAAVAVWLAWPDPAALVPAMHRRWRVLPQLRPPVAPSPAPALAALATELAAGAAPASALIATAQARQHWPHALAAAQAGGDVADAFESDGAWDLAACWRIAGSHGAGLARAIDALARHERESAAVRARLAAELAGPRASARMLAALPLVGLAMGVLMGADPLGFLLGGIGLLCLLVAALLTGVGLLWGARITRTVEQLL